MKSLKLLFKPATLVLFAASLVCGAALAEKPEGAGGGKGHKNESKQDGKGKDKDKKSQASSDGKYSGSASGSGTRVDIQIGGYFGDQQRVVVRDYYAGQAKAGKCPPGLAKKNNGCMPPGQAKKWSVGRPLPGDVVFYPVPSSVSVRLGVPPSGHRYVRVASDILLIAVGTSMVVDAITDLGSM